MAIYGYDYDYDDGDDFKKFMKKMREKEAKEEEDLKKKDLDEFLGLEHPDEPSKEQPKKEKKPKKIFNVGDVLTLKKTKQGKLPDEAYDFLMTYGRFDVIEVNENGNLYLGFDRNGEKFFFNSNRFELRAPNKEEDNFFEDEMDDF